MMLTSWARRHLSGRRAATTWRCVAPWCIVRGAALCSCFSFDCTAAKPPSLTQQLHYPTPQVLNYLIEQGADVAHRGYGGMSALHHAANGMHEASLVALLDAGADANQADDGGNTAMHFNASRGVMAIAIILQERGADLDVQNKAGASALMKCAANGQLTLAQRMLQVRRTRGGSGTLFSALS